MDFLLTLPAFLSLFLDLFILLQKHFLQINFMHDRSQKNKTFLNCQPSQLLEKFPLKEMKVSRWKKALEMSDELQSIQITEIWSCQD